MEQYKFRGLGVCLPLLTPRPPDRRCEQVPPKDDPSAIAFEGMMTVALLWSNIYTRSQMCNYEGCMNQIFTNEK